ncbi:ROK family protein [Aestuariibius insulae]|uniref:ROK family protein n=1 Tax=Aestuariibius insulae TaxID=2058287 RepID=UPI00345E6033
MTLSGGIDIGGTKIAAHLFGPGGEVLFRHRAPTPQTYPALVEALQDLIAAIRSEAGEACPVGIGLPGRVDPVTGGIDAANLPLSGHILQSDLPDGVALLNDVRAFALGEAAKVPEGSQTLVGLAIGTGLAAACVPGPVGSTGIGGEIGHLPLPAPLVMERGLPLLDCPCGRQGCMETLFSGPGLTRLAAHRRGAALSSEEAAEDPGIWDDWLAIGAHVLLLLVHTYDPHRIVLGGGLSARPDLARDLTARLEELIWEDTSAPAIEVSTDPVLSATRGAARFAQKRER